MPVRLVMVGGLTLDAVLFLHAARDRGPGARDLGEQLRDPNTFFLPCVVGRGVELVNLEHVALVEGPRGCSELEHPEDLPARGVQVELLLTHGETLSGELRYSLPPGSCRISDLFNRDTERFVLVTTKSASVYVNRRAVGRVRLPAEDPRCP